MECAMSKLLEQITALHELTAEAACYRELGASLMLLAQSIQEKSDEVRDILDETLGKDATAQIISDAQAEGKLVAEEESAQLQYPQIDATCFAKEMYAHLLDVEGTLNDVFSQSSQTSTGIEEQGEEPPKIGFGIGIPTRE